MPKDSDQVGFNYASAVKIADTVHRVLGRGAGERPVAKRPRHVGAASKGSTTITTSLAIVTATAAKNGGAGKAVPLDGRTLEPVVEIDAGAPDFDEDKYNDAVFDFYCAHQYSPCPAGERIQWFKVRGRVPGGMFEPPHDEDFIYGLLTDCVVELSTRTGFAADKALVGGGSADAIEWDGTTCE